ncbi:MAG: 23S rRNA (guanosine(2251)-2'-O)-methyltransferase RlmB [Syntrophomonadaceae bacterium]|nr:23S rRNA (guanosine(2251)-2'-O)-methyltransferase RlmB [Syntrophomonadaceae bacterium]
MQEKITGVNSVMEALKGQREVYKIFVQESRKKSKRIEELLQLAREKGVHIQYTARQLLDQMYRPGNHQGIIAEVGSYRYAGIDDIFELAALRGQRPLIVILDGLEDPQNLGSVIRCAEAAGVHGVIIPRHNSVKITPAVARASAGAVEHMLIVRETNLVNAIKLLKERGLWIIGADMKGENDYFSVGIPSPTAIIIGGEGRGIRRLVRENCDLLARIPMQGKVNSLNAAIAAALFIYEAIRQRNLSGPQ